MCPKRDLFDAASDDAAAGGCFVLRDVRLFDLADAAGGAVDSEDDAGGGAVDSEDAAVAGVWLLVVRVFVVFAMLSGVISGKE